jgi:hypothetical protein
MSIAIDRVVDDPSRAGETVTYVIKLKKGATKNEIIFFNDVADKLAKLNKHFNYVNATAEQINVQVEGLPFAEMIAKVEGLIEQANVSDDALSGEIKAYNEKIKQNA